MTHDVLLALSQSAYAFFLHFLRNIHRVFLFFLLSTYSKFGPKLKWERLGYVVIFISTSFQRGQCSVPRSLVEIYELRYAERFRRFGRPKPTRAKRLVGYSFPKNIDFLTIKIESFNRGQKMCDPTNRIVFQRCCKESNLNLPSPGH